jgi:hypothetical protein
MKASARLLKELNSIKMIGEIIKKENTAVTIYGVNLCSTILTSIFDFGEEAILLHLFKR